MALPKKRKKLEDTREHPAGVKKSTGKAGEKKEKSRPAKAAGPAGTKNSEQMDKAFDIMEQIEGTRGTAPLPSPADTREERPGTLRLRISLDGSAPGDTAAPHSSAHRKPRSLDLTITIPSFVWKVPLLRTAAAKILKTLPPED